MWKREQLLCPSVCVRFVKGFLFAGVGADLRVYESISPFRVFSFPCLSPGTMIRGIRVLDYQLFPKLPPLKENQQLIAIFGQKRTKCFLWDTTASTSYFFGSFEEIWDMEESDDWIWDVMVGCTDESQKTQLIRITAHNVVEVWDVASKTLTNKIISSDNSILYSASLYYSREKGFLAACGTVFNHVLIWAPFQSSKDILIRLIGHEGVIFGLTWNKHGDSIISTSDDRSARVWDDIWKVERCEGKIFHGHIARVWRSVWIGDLEWPNHIVSQPNQRGRLFMTCSEDMTCRIWNSLTGQCVGIYHGHSGKNVWSIAIDKKRMLAVSSGADGGIKMWSVYSILDQYQGGVKSSIAFPGKLIEKFPESASDYVQVLEVVDQHKVLIATRSGFILFLHLPQLKWEVLYRQEGSVFRFMCTSPASSSLHPQYVLLGEDAGSLTLLSMEKNTTPVKIHAHKRITSLFWPDGKNVFSGGYDLSGFSCKWWVLEEFEGVISFKLKATIGAEKEIIRSLIISPLLPGKLVAGDAKGSVFFYDTTMLDTCNDEIPHLTPTASFLRVHGKERVSSLFVTTEEVYSVGRDGRLCTYQCTSNGVEMASTGKIKKRVDNTEKMYGVGASPNQQLYVVGFYGGKLVVEGLDTGAQLLSIECGGLHRPHHFKFIVDGNEKSGIASDASLYTCAFLQRKHIHVHQSSLLQHNMHDISSSQYTFQEALHGIHINEVSFLGDRLFITGSDDTTMKIVECQEKGYKIHQTLRGQASSIRCVATSHSNSNHSQTILFSGGGEYCLLAWNYSKEAKQCILAKKYVKRKQADCRIMNVTAFGIAPDLHIVCIGLSNSFIEVLGYQSKRREFFQLSTLKSHFGPVLALEHLHHHNNDFLFSASTDGRLLVWNIAAVVSFFLQEESNHTDLSPLVELEENLFPVLVHEHFHQSGVSNLSVSSLDTDNVMITSGGDDQSISCLEIRLGETVEVKQAFGNSLAHRAAVTCAVQYESYVISTGPDQRVSVWKLVKNESSLWDLHFLSSYFCDIADGSSLDIQKGDAPGSIRILVAGMGVQCLSYNP